MSHWKSLFDYKHLGCQDLPRDAQGRVQDIVVSIKVLEKREVVGEAGRKEILPVADLLGASKPMIMNKTNLGTLADLFETTEYEQYLNKPFILYAAKVKGKAGGIVDGLRIRPTKPNIVTEAKEELTPEHTRWPGAKKAVASGDTTIENIKKAFSLSPENELLLTAK